MFVFLVFFVSSVGSQTILHVTLQGSAPPAPPLPYPFENNVNPQGQVLSADGCSFLRDTERWFPIAGEIHYARIPITRWREELLRLKAGGLDAVDVYTFWIHHEEVEGQFVFSGRRDLRTFILTAQDVGLSVFLRIGPWCHGEARNGGHPDWLLAKAAAEHFELRANNTQYMSYVSLFYAQLGVQLQGLFYKDGGPISTVQLDNETPDWEYLLALRETAIAAGILPPSFVKTKWPTPNTGFPLNFPMLMPGGAYPDLFWTSSMQNTPASSLYFFAFSGQKPPGNFSAYPNIMVEMGGGMAAAYEHRPHMDSGDMPSFQLVLLQQGAASFGFYMYHGGNNPSSLTPGYSDAPNETLQESSFMPAGPQNPMPSMSYDFFAPLGEFGQDRLHYHWMRMTHLMLQSFGSMLATWLPDFPDVLPTNVDDLDTLRWGMRGNGYSAFLFVNNYQRLQALPAHENIKFLVTLSNGENVSIPSNDSSALAIPPNTWFVLPVNIPLDGVYLVWATAQVVAYLPGPLPDQQVLFLICVGSLAPELAFSSVGVEVLNHTGSLSVEGDTYVLRGVVPGTDPVIVLRTSNGTLQMVVLPPAASEQTWGGTMGGVARLFLCSVNFLLVDGSTIQLRSNFSVGTPIDLLVFPPIADMFVNGTPLSSSSNGVFQQVVVKQPPVDLPTVSIVPVSSAGPPRSIPKSGGISPAEEPTAEDWLQAAFYNISLSGVPPLEMSEMRLHINYWGDSARFMYGSHLLTDNWFTGYEDDGAFEVGISYLAAENNDLLVDPTFQLLILPLRQDTIETIVYLQNNLWPPNSSFTGSPPSVLQLRDVNVLYNAFINVTCTF